MSELELESVSESVSESLVILKCIKEGSRLRIKIISRGYHTDANCQFPKDIRLEGRTYSVPSRNIKFTEGPGRKYFYRINKSDIKIIGSTIESDVTSVVTSIFEDESVTECIICMSADKNTVFASCGHYACCSDCSKTIFNTTKKCPICRSRILELVHRENIQI